MLDKQWPVTEIYGPVVQGEGIMVGQQTMFLRMAGCDYRCSWCDTLYSVLPVLIENNHTKMTAEEIISSLLTCSRDCKTVTISGGNPCIHAMEDVIDKLVVNHYYISIETQGTFYQDWLEACDMITVSPKPPSSGMKTDWAKLDAFMKPRTWDDTCLKVVVFDADDYLYAKAIRKAYQGFPLYLQPGTVVNEPTNLRMREGIISSTRNLIDRVTADPDMRTARVVPQMHVLLYGQKRGV